MAATDQKTAVVSQPMLFPWPGMFEQIRLADTYVIYDDVQFPRRSFTNRVQLKTANGPLWITVPVAHAPRSALIQDIRIGDGEWRRQHRRTFASTYAGADFLDDALGLMDETYETSTPMLVDLLVNGLHSVCRYLGGDFPAPTLRSSTLNVPGSATERLVRISARVGASIYVTGHGARNYLDHQQFESAGIQVRYMDYSLSEYPQFHGAFTPHVSILDMIAHLGRQAADHIRPNTVYWRDFLPASDGDRTQRK